MIGFVIGLVCGIAELFLIKKLVTKITAGKSNFLGLLFLKFLVLAASLASCILFFRDQLIYLSTGIASALIIGSVVLFIINSRKLKKKGDDRK